MQTYKEGMVTVKGQRDELYCMVQLNGRGFTVL